MELSCDLHVTVTSDTIELVVRAGAETLGSVVSTTHWYRPVSSISVSLMTMVPVPFTYTVVQSSSPNGERGTIPGPPVGDLSAHS